GGGRDPAVAPRAGGHQRRGAPEGAGRGLMHAWIRAAASRQTGLGHLLREVALAERLQDRGVTTTFVVDDPPFAHDALARFSWPGGDPPVQGADGWLADVSD